jgi:Ser-tRNA(Ala) deacylase AlaX
MVWQIAPTIEQQATYLEDSYLTEVVTRVVAVGGSGSRIAVRENVFHPQGGGQPADRGWIGEAAGVPVRDDDGLVYLLVSEPTGLSEGDVVRARVDAELRLLHAALHTAGHVVDGVTRSEGWTWAGNNHFPGQARIEFTSPGPIELSGAAERIQAGVDTAIAADLAVTAVAKDGHRVVRIGDLHQEPCGGTHVRSLADLASVTITGVKVKKGRVRVSYTATHRPLR